jgi:hypothetical protein
MVARLALLGFAAAAIVPSVHGWECTCLAAAGCPTMCEVCECSDSACTCKTPYPPPFGDSRRRRFSDARRRAPPPPTPKPTPPPTPAPPTPAPLRYGCNAATGQCYIDPKGTQSAADCEGACKAAPTPPPPPTPSPTPAVMYKCDTTTGNCLVNGQGTQTAAQCAASCKCEIPHNCGQLNGTYVCGKKMNDCNVCDECCKFYILPQDNCNECVAQAAPPAGKGCGWPNMTKVH